MTQDYNSEPSRRLLTLQQAAVYCGVSPATFLKICPVSPLKLGPSRRLCRFDVKSLDRWIEKLNTSTAQYDIDWLAMMDSDNVGRPRKRP